jgi:hypothetical protein
VVDALGLELSYRITPGIWHAAIMADMDWKWTDCLLKLFEVHLACQLACYLVFRGKCHGGSFAENTNCPVSFPSMSEENCERRWLSSYHFLPQTVLLCFESNPILGISRSMECKILGSYFELHVSTSNWWRLWPVLWKWMMHGLPVHLHCVIFAHYSATIEKQCLGIVLEIEHSILWSQTIIGFLETIRVSPPLVEGNSRKVFIGMSIAMLRHLSSRCRTQEFQEIV